MIKVTIVRVYYVCTFCTVPPSVEATVDRITAVQGDTVTLSCTATGIPTPTIDWYNIFYTYIYDVMIPSNVSIEQKQLHNVYLLN